MSAIEAKNLARKYKETWGLRSASFVVAEGELAVLAGPNGTGKSTTVRILSTFLKPSEGSARILGFDTVRDYKEVRKRIAYMPQEYDVSRDLTPIEALVWNLVARGGWSVSEARLQAKRWLERLGMWDLRNRTSWGLSGGERRRVAVAMNLSCESKVAFLDEPTIGLDVEIKHTVWKAVRQSVSAGSTMLLSTHDMVEAETISDKVIMMSEGRTVAEEESSKLIASLPYRYRVVVEGSSAPSLAKYSDSGGIVDLGDRRILYVKDRDEALSLVETTRPMSNVYSLTEVGLEDAYLHIIGNASKKKE